MRVSRSASVRPIFARMDLDFSDDEITRYSRHILLAEVGGTGQAKLRAARVLVVGAGGLGSPLVLYLAAAGIGTIGIVDDDLVELSNLQRQVAHTTARLGTPKVDSAADGGAARSIPACGIEAHAEAADAANALELIGALRHRLRRHRQFRHALPGGGRLRAGAAHAGLGRGAAVRGPALGVQAARGRARATAASIREPPPDGVVPSCSEAGVLGAVTGVMGTLQATEVLKEILGIGEIAGGQTADLGRAGQPRSARSGCARIRTARPAGRRRRLRTCRRTARPRGGTGLCRLNRSASC